MNSISSPPLATAIASSACPRAVPSLRALPQKSTAKRKEIGEALEESKRRRHLRFVLERRRNSVVTAALPTSSSSSSSSSLSKAASSALARSLYPDVVRDPFGALLAEAAGLKQEEEGEEESDGQPPPSAFAAVAAAFADSALLSATDLVNFETGDSRGREYRQVVLLGPGLDARAQRVEWPAGTVLFECASTDAHAVSASALASERARRAFADEEKRARRSGGSSSPSSAPPAPALPSSFGGSGAPRGRLLRRVACDVSTAGGREGLAQALFDNGFRAERLSAWCVNAGALFDEGGRGSSRLAGLRELFGAVASCAAFCSFVVGDLPEMTRKEAEDVVACSGILGSVLEFGSEDDVAGSELWERRGWNRTEKGNERRRRFLFVGQQRTRSDAELGILAEFSRAAEEAEGFEDNIS